MSKWKRAAHARYQLGYHFAWSPKYRKGILGGKARKELLAEVLRGIGERYGFEVSTIGIADDHLHLFIEAAPRFAPAELVKVIKSISARELFRAFPELRRQLWGGELWEDGYAVRAVSDQVTEAIVRRYIEAHHIEEGHEPRQLQLF